MTSEERKEYRYQRRKKRREEKKWMKCQSADDYERVFAQKNLRHAYKKCRKNVSWKGSVQRYIIRSPVIIASTYKALMAGKYKCSGFDEFDTKERGVLRHIRAIRFPDRVVQRCLCDNSLVPVLTRSFVYDNGASQTGKGYDFAVNRMTCHLQRHYRKFGNSGYILLFDFSKFFDNVSHRVLSRILHKQFTDSRIIQFVEKFVALFGEKGLGLGSQISQVMALTSANDLDHFVKEKLRIKGYSRYMDDGYIISDSKEKLVLVLEKIKGICENLEIKLNQKKTRIEKISHGFSWMKIRWHLTETGKVVRKIYKRSVTKMRGKIKKFPSMIKKGKLSIEHACMAVQSWRGYAKQFHAYHNLKRMDLLWKKVFPDYSFDVSAEKKIKRKADQILTAVGQIKKMETESQMSPKHIEYAWVSWEKEIKKTQNSYDTSNNEIWKRVLKEFSNERKAA